MSNVPSQIVAEFDKYPSYERGDNLTRSIFDVGLYDTVAALAMQDSVTPILAAHRLRHELQSAPGWQTCFEFVTQTLADMAKDPKKYFDEVFPV